MSACGRPVMLHGVITLGLPANSLATHAEDTHTLLLSNQAVAIETAGGTENRAAYIHYYLSLISPE
jgi:hypothetical protein